VTLFVCETCQQHIVSIGICPTCTESPNRAPRSLALLLGLGLMGCGDKTADSSIDTEDSGIEAEPVEPADEPMYGISSVSE